MAVRAHLVRPGIPRVHRPVGGRFGRSPRAGAGAAVVSVRLLGGTGARSAQAFAEATAARAVVDALAAELSTSAPLRADGRVSGDGRPRSRQEWSEGEVALFHPIRLVLTGEAEGLELDVAVPAIRTGVRRSARAGIRPCRAPRKRCGRVRSGTSRAIDFSDIPNPQSQTPAPQSPGDDGLRIDE